MNEYRITLPWPPSNNTYYRHGRGKNYISVKGEKYRQSVIKLIRSKNLDIKTPARLKFKITANPPDKRRRDLDNMLKAPFDSLTHAGFMCDDEQIDDFRIIRGEIVKCGSLEIVITEIGA